MNLTASIQQRGGYIKIVKTVLVRLQRTYVLKPTKRTARIRASCPIGMVFIVN